MDDLLAEAARLIDALAYEDVPLPVIDQAVAWLREHGYDRNPESWRTEAYRPHVTTRRDHQPGGPAGM